jgi:hypothetical protein
VRGGVFLFRLAGLGLSWLDMGGESHRTHLPSSLVFIHNFKLTHYQFKNLAIPAL